MMHGSNKTGKALIKNNSWYFSSTEGQDLRILQKTLKLLKRNEEQPNVTVIPSYCKFLAVWENRWQSLFTDKKRLFENKEYRQIMDIKGF